MPPFQLNQESPAVFPENRITTHIEQDFWHIKNKLKYH